MSVQDQLKDYLESHFPDKFNGGELERMTFLSGKGSPAKPSNISRRLRDLAEEGKIEKVINNGSVWYKAKHGKMLEGIPIFKPKAEGVQTKLL